MHTKFLELIPAGATKIDGTRWRLVTDVDGVAVPVTLESLDDVLLVHTTIEGLPVPAMAADLLALNRVLRRVRIGADDTMITVWADLDLAGPLDERVMSATLDALRDTTADVLALGGRAIGGPDARVVGVS